MATVFGFGPSKWIRGGVLIVLVCVAVAAAAEPVVLVPPAKEVSWSDAPPLPLEDGKIAIVVGSAAESTERYAARILADHVSRRFGRQWPVVAETDDLKNAGVLVVLGQPNTCQLVNRLCDQQQIDLAARSPGFDGYVIRVIADGERPIALVGGCNGRGVIYGADTLFQMLSVQDEQLVLSRADIRDWPTIPWRGRPQTHVAAYLRPGELDAYMRARINFIDLRSGIYAFEPGEELNKPQIRAAVEQAHERGLFIYATVNCGVPKAEYPQVMQTFNELLELGADGLWPSFDDKGPGEAPVEMINQMLELGRKHNITGRAIAVTPPKGDYQQVLMPFNKQIMAIPGMQEALWFWTFVPAPEETDRARSIGMKALPSWWHNWPRPNKTYPYNPIVPMSVGWNGPSYEVLANCAGNAEAVMPWGGNAWGVDYLIPVIGWWCWDPKAHDWDRVRDRIYDTVFGPKASPGARGFDDTLMAFRALLRVTYPEREDAEPDCPDRLFRLDDRERAGTLLTRMHENLSRIWVAGNQTSLLPPERVSDAYLKPMRAELELGRILVGLPYPEYWWPDAQRHILAAVHAGDLATADRLITEARSLIEPDLKRIREALGKEQQVDGYLDTWESIARRDAAGWKQLLGERRESRKALIDEYAYLVMKISTMTDGMPKPPLGVGTGRWERQHRLLATVLPRDEEQYWGKWTAGLYPFDEPWSAVFAADRRSTTSAGHYAELPVTLPVTGRRDRLALLLFASSANKQKIGLDFVSDRWATYRYLEVLQGDRVIWQLDVGRQHENGDWHLIRLDTIPADVVSLDLRLRVRDRLDCGPNHTIVYTSPLYLLELAEQ